MKRNQIHKTFLYDKFKNAVKSRYMQYVMNADGELTEFGILMFIAFIQIWASKYFFFENAFSYEPYKYFFDDYNELMKKESE